MNRSTTTELDLEAGQYLVMVKITASRVKSSATPEDIVKKNCETRPDKLMAVGLSYDLAHAKGHLKESGLEHQEYLRKERRDKRKLKAKKAFEAQSMLDKKEKLRRLRLEAKEKAKMDKESKGDQDTDGAIEISIRLGESTLITTKSQGADETVGTSNFMLKDGTSKQLKIIFEDTDKDASVKSGDQPTSGEIKQPAEGEDKQAKDAKQAPEGEKQDNIATSVSGLESGTSQTKPTTPTESTSTTEDNNKTEGQPSTKPDENVVTGEKATPTTSPGEDIHEPSAVEPAMQPPPLTLDTISSDGLSWSSDIDAPSDTSSDTSSDTDSGSEVDESAPSAPTDPPPGDSADDPAKDPWNAVCVFGLRVYSKGSQAEIDVVRKGDEAESKKLDVDDQAADATKKLQKGGPGDEREGEAEGKGEGETWKEVSRQG